MPRLHFVLDAPAERWRDIESLGPDDIAAAPRRFVGGRNSWIAQTYVRLKAPLLARGWDVTVGTRYAPGAICLAHRDDANGFRGGAHRSFLVVVRADRPPVHACDLAIVQNATIASARERYVPLWPQPGIVPRDPRRGARVSRIAYLGRTASAPRWFFDDGFRSALERRAVTFEIREREWHRYEDVDVVLAARREAHAVLAVKPASKLCNGWIAGAPVLASPEPAYRALRRSPQDFLEVEGPADVLGAIDRLQAAPELYRAMVENGRRRAAEFGCERIAERWIALLEGEVLARFERFRPSAARAAWFHAALARQKLTNRIHRCEVGLQRIGLALAGEPPWEDPATKSRGEREPAATPAWD